jgi:hypothetical protein
VDAGLVFAGISTVAVAWPAGHSLPFADTVDAHTETDEGAKHDVAPEPFDGHSQVTTRN